MALQPKILVADEPTSALDVSIQAQVLNLFMDLQEQLKTAYVFVSHNLAVVEHIANDVMVMYLGRVVESGPKATIFANALHPYTQALLSATPSIDPAHRQKKIKIQGELPSPLDPPSGCAFHKRCPLADARCESELPVLRELQGRQDIIVVMRTRLLDTQLLLCQLSELKSRPPLNGIECLLIA
jgi:dipeptide transport system ATP-binding protein